MRETLFVFWGPDLAALVELISAHVSIKDHGLAFTKPFLYLRLGFKTVRRIERRGNVGVKRYKIAVLAVKALAYEPAEKIGLILREIECFSRYTLLSKPLHKHGGLRRLPHPVGPVNNN